MAIPPLNDFKRFPDMVHWFNPVLLCKLLNNVVTSAMFGQYADRRLIVAALDTVPVEEHERRAKALRTEGILRSDGPVWFDFVADLGDGFDSTYAVASLLARKELVVPRHADAAGDDAQQADGAEIPQPKDEILPRGQFLLMGGDEVYPLAEAQTYLNQLKQPYKWALPDPNKEGDDGIPLFAIPGNHDWYDGLVLFLAHFCREKPSHFGAWRSRQRRSYFAIQLTSTWWLWAIDIQLAEDMDQPQADYFVHIAKAMDPNSRIVLCSAEPGWLYTDTNTQSWNIMDFAIGLANKAGKDLTIPALLSGDTHHYSRYAAADGTQFITSGGGGAFLHPTHQLEPQADVKWRVHKRHLTLAKKNDDPKAEEAVYPSMDISRDLLWGNFKFALTNWDFSILMGVIYFIVGVAVGLRDLWDVYLIITIVMAIGIFSYTTDQEKVSLIDTLKEKRRLAEHPDPSREAQNNAVIKNTLQFKKASTVYAASLIHTLAQAVASIGFAHYVNVLVDWSLGDFGGRYHVWPWLIALFVAMGAVGFLVGSTIFGLNMLVTCRYLRMNRNDAFSALRIGRYNNFLRICIEGDTARVYAIGLDDVPSRDDWIDNPKRNEPGESHFIPRDGKALKHHLIERIEIKGAVTPA